MVEFNGYITGLAEVHFHNRARLLGQKLLIGGFLLFLPAVLSFAMRLKDCDLVVAYLAIIGGSLLLTMIPKSKRERTSIKPKKIVVDQDYIVCVADKYTETRGISDVKIVKDFGEFYELCFPFGKVSDKFICQKSLLTRGSIREFEALFEGKITRMKTYPQKQ